MINLDFNPPLLLRSPHLQTIMAGFAKKGTEPPSKFFDVLLSEGDQLRCKISTPSTWTEDQPIVLMVHGLGGSSQSSYMIRIAQHVFNLGIKCVRINLRNSGDGEGLSKICYCAGNSTDILNVLEQMHHLHPRSPLILAGFSLGGNIVLKLAGELEKKGSELIHSIFACCSPLNLSYTAHALQQGFNKIYDWYYLKSLQKQVPTIPRWSEINTLYDFDNIYVAPLWGYKSAEDYYSQCSSSKFIPSIKVPTTLLFASDDPLIDCKEALSFNNPSLRVTITQGGGHMGFFNGFNLTKNYWLDEFFLRWLNDLIAIS